MMMVIASTRLETTVSSGKCRRIDWTGLLRPKITIVLVVATLAVQKYC